MTGAADRPVPPKGGFRDLRVVARIAESRLITSFHLQSADGASLPTFQPGQFLALRIPSDGPEGTVLRHYSLSGSPDDQGHYRISVKREGAGGTAGRGSSWLHDHVQVGSVLSADGPRGAFVLDQTSDRPVVLISGGVGLTPMVAMLHTLASRSDRAATFLHACDCGDLHALRDEVDGIVAQRPGLAAHYCYRAPDAADRADGRFHSEGMLTRTVLQAVLPLDDYDFYLCGPPPFMQATYQTLRGLGVAANRIAYEFFGPATVLDADPAPVPVSVVAAAPSGAITVEFRKSGVTVPWDDAASSLLAFAEDQGLRPDFSCRAGVCGTCISRIVAGDVSYVEDPLDEPDQGQILLCCAKPATSIVLDL